LLKAVDISRTTFLSDLPEGQLNHLLEHAEQLTLEPGQVLMDEGSLPDAFYVVLDGDFDIVKQSPGQEETVVTVTGSGEILGEISLIANAPRLYTVRAARRSRVLKISTDLFKEVLLGSPEKAMGLLRTVMERLRVAQSMLGQKERLASLGTLAAGLAHELNNPAAAARRSADQLRTTLNDWLLARNDLDALHLDKAEADYLFTRLQQDVGHNGHSDAADDPLACSDREEALLSWMEEQGVENAWVYASILAEFGWEVAELQSWCSRFEQAHIPVILRWVTAGYNIHNLLDEIYDSTDRISEIVAAVKSYSFLDQAPRKEIDVHEGLESTLVILKHKLKAGINVRREYDRSLPRIEAYAGELNQLWTNLIDNAIDAMGGTGELVLRTYREKDMLVVEITDNGPGIPETVLEHIFEPFFTTKGPGSGNGLGLHISYSVVQKHRGKIEVFSKPGNTRFKVSLPMEARLNPAGR